MLAPIVDELAVEFDGRAKVVKINAGENFETAGAYGIRMLPTVLLFQGGQVVGQSGVASKDELTQMIESKLS